MLTTVSSPALPPVIPRRFFVFAIFLTAILSRPAQGQVHEWLTTEDRSSLLAEQPAKTWVKHAHAPGAAPVINVDDGTSYQSIDGFGHALTGGSAQLLMKMSPRARHALLQEFFGAGPADLHTTYLRISIGASDMNDHVYTYDDLPEGSTDMKLEHFSVHEDEQDVIPVLKEILAIQPQIHLIATPWTAPAWMKTNHAIKGGALDPQFYEVYSRYFVAYLKAMQAHGIAIETLSPQNEPENPHNTPSMLMSAIEEATFIGKDLGPALAAAGLRTKIIAFDHNCDHPGYPEAVLADPTAAAYTDGSGFHLYLGTIDALSEVHKAFPEKNIYFTEQLVTQPKDQVALEVARPVRDLIIGAPSNWSRNVLLWNLAADPENGPHTGDGGCPVCRGAVTLDGDQVTRLVAYYTAAHASKFVPSGSKRIGSAANAPAMAHVAFRTPQGRHVLIASNTEDQAQVFVIDYKGKQVAESLEAHAVATYVW